MNTYYVIGIHAETGCLRQLSNGETQHKAMERALEYAGEYLQLFLVQPNLNPQELFFKPAVLTPAMFVEGEIGPVIDGGSF
ncbi:hypothetical protein LCGC14_1723860 [marine sediment metagenome]|uniref:Uncharacterized protein n=1 Tax=marine sediment metagenome TaxID=412755 RepID=A0A0F9KBB4_9ZZZZ